MIPWGNEFYLLVLIVTLTRSLRSLLRDANRTSHSKIKFVSPRGHVMSFMCSTHVSFR